MLSSHSSKMIAGAITMLAGPLLGGGLTTLSMFRSFQTLGADGIAKPAELSAEVGNALIFTAIGMGIGGLGLILLIIGVVGYFTDPKRGVGQDAQVNTPAPKAPPPLPPTP